MSFVQTLLKALKESVADLEEELARCAVDPPNVWDAHATGLDDPERLLSWKAFDKIAKIRLDLSAFEAAVTPSPTKLLTLGLLPVKTSALNVAVTLDIANTIDELGGTVKIEDLATKLSTNENKLSRVMRTLAGEYIFKEVSPGVFSNTRHSISLKNENAREFMSLLSDEGLRSIAGLTDNMKSPLSKDSFDPSTAPFCSTVATDGLTFPEYLGVPENAHVVSKVVNGVVPWLNRTTRQSLLVDYPWGERSDICVVDIGCGPGDAGYDIMRKYPNLQWIFQDLPPVIKGNKEQVPNDMTSKVQNGAIRFVEQDYFEANKSDGDLWFLRGIIREYDDDDAIKILKQVATAMKRTPSSRMVINEILISTPALVPKDSMTLTPSQLVPEHQSTMVDLANLMTWNTFAFFGGKERSFSEVEHILERAGLRVSRFFPLRTFTANIECTLIDG